MHPVAIDKARSRLRTSRKAFEDLKTSQDMNSFNDAWYSFLTATKNIYDILKKGAATTSPQSLQWYGAKARERRNDELLQYIYEARNADEHGLERSAARIPGSFAIRGNVPGFSESVELNGMVGPGGILRITPLDNKPVYAEITPAHVGLVAVTGRGRIYQPPLMHLGKRLESNRPIPVAELTLTYLEGLVEEASKLA